MKFRYYSKLPDEPVPGVSKKDSPGEYLGRTIVPADDNVGYTEYEIRPKRNDTLLLKSPAAVAQVQRGVNHHYCFLDGTGVLETSAGDRYQVERNCLLALPPAETGEFTASDDHCRVAVIHSRSNSADPSRPRPTFRSLTSLLGSARDVDWHKGRSRRFLVQADGFNLSIHNTTCHPGHVSPLWYPNNHEVAYYVRGDVRYDWAGGKESASFKQEDVSAGDGMMMVMDENDQHTVNTFSKECECLCVFYPPLTGTETHDFSKEGFSAF